MGCFLRRFARFGMNFPIVFRQLGLLLLLLAATLLAHAGVAGIYWNAGDEAEEAALWAFLTAAGVASVLGGIGMFWFRGAIREIGRREACLLVVSAWLIGAIIAAIPCASIGGRKPRSLQPQGGPDATSIDRRTPATRFQVEANRLPG